MRSPLLLLPCLLVGLVFPSSAQEDLAERMENAIALLRSSGQADPSAIAMMLSSAAEGYIQKEDYGTALARIQESIALSRKHDLDPTMPFFTASKILSKTDEEAAKQFLLRELTAPGTSNAYKKGVLKALDLHLALHGDQQLAVQAAHESWRLTKQENPGSEEEFHALYRYATHCLSAKLYDIAGPALREAKELAIALGKTQLAAHCARSIGFALVAEREPEQALGHFREALQYIRRSGEDTFLFFELSNIAAAELELGRLDQAAATIEQAVAAARNEMEEGIARSLLAVLELKRGVAGGGTPDWSSVIEHQEAAVAAKRKNDAAGEEMALLGATQDLLALAAYEVLAGEAEQAEATLAIARRGIGAWEANIRTARQSAVFSADQVNLSLSSLHGGLSEIEQRVHLAGDDRDAALVAAENGRGAAQAALMREKLGLPATEQAAKNLTRDDIVRIAGENDTTLVVYSVAHPFAAGTRRFFRLGDPEVPPATLYAWVVSPDGTISFEATSLEQPLGPLVEAARREILEPSSAPAAGGAMEKLSDLLIDPIADRLPENPAEVVTFVPHGPLFLVPFPALSTPDGRALIERLIVSQSASIELLDLARIQKEAVIEAGKEEILIVGNPTMPGYRPRPDRDAEALSPLPGAEAEARFLGESLRVSPLIGDAATEVEVARRMPEARFLHFATHGLLETGGGYNQSLLSSLAFAASPEEDGFLTVRETARMNLRAELAVLSACDTGRGRISGDGVIGLSRGYLSAGVPTVVVSLWPVSDQATAFLMGRYYTALTGGEGKAAALRQSILDTREKFPQPKLWAPFVLYGLPR